MGRPLRPDEPKSWHHVTNRGGCHRIIFHDEEDRRLFLYLLGVIRQRYAVEVHAHCLMDNHFHLLVYCPDGNLSAAMQYLCGIYVRTFNRRHGRDGALFRGRFNSVQIRNDAHLRLAGRYIHRNALDTGPSVDLARYRWSSYSSYVGAERGPWWLVRSMLLSIHGDSTERLRRFTESVHPQDTTAADPTSQTASQWTVPDNAEPARVWIPSQPPTLAEIAAAVERVFPAEDEPEDRASTRRRLAAVKLSHRVGIAPSAISKLLGRSTSTVWADLRRARVLSNADESFVLRCKEAERLAWDTDG